MAVSLEEASEAYREAMRESVKRYSLWHLVQGCLLVAAGVLAIIYPAVSATAAITVLGWLLVVSGALQAISLIGAGKVPHFWLQLIAVVISVLIGLLFLRDPGQGLVMITLLLIVFFMIAGVTKVTFALTLRPFPNWTWVLASGLFGIALALFLWSRLPVSAVWIIGLMIGLHLIGEGGALVKLAWGARRS
jgi:uncharacterized membrane protein HdeD (DUF308 family)